MLSSLAEVLNLVLVHVAVVFGQRARELMGAVVPADEVQKIGVGRMHGSVERGAAGRRDGTRRQAGIAVGVVRRVEREIVATQVAGVGAGALQRVDDRGIGLE